MTTMEISMNLSGAIDEAGIGGTVERNGIEYTVLWRDGGAALRLSSEPYDNGSAVHTFNQDGWTVTSRVESTGTQEETAPQTIRQFFESLPDYSYITINGSDYIFAGWDHEGGDDGDELQARVFHAARYMSEDSYSGYVLEEQNETLAILLDDDGEQKIASRELRHALRHLSASRRNSDLLSKRYDETLDLVNSLQQDFKRVNDFINEYADENHMCSDYERRIFGWNDSLTNKLVGRLRDYSVAVHIPELSEYNMEAYPVKARSQEEARETVRGWSRATLIANLAERGYSFDALTVNFVGDDA